MLSLVDTQHSEDRSYGRYVYISIFYAFFIVIHIKQHTFQRLFFSIYMFNYFIYIFFFNIHCTTSTCSSTTTTTTTKTHQDSGHVFLVGGSFCSFLMFLFFIFIIFFSFWFLSCTSSHFGCCSKYKKKFNRTLIIVLRYVFFLLYLLLH